LALSCEQPPKKKGGEGVRGNKKEKRRRRESYHHIPIPQTQTPIKRIPKIPRQRRAHPIILEEIIHRPIRIRAQNRIRLEEQHVISRRELFPQPRLRQKDRELDGEGYIEILRQLDDFQPPAIDEAPEGRGVSILR
jgi:hypothetical protein